eukprot:1039663-Rhodomonas_salina.2
MRLRRIGSAEQTASVLEITVAGLVLFPTLHAECVVPTKSWPRIVIVLPCSSGPSNGEAMVTCGRTVYKNDMVASVNDRHPVSAAASIH